MHLSVAPERENRMNGVNIIIKELMTENSEELKKVSNPQILKAKLVLSKINKKNSTLKDNDFIFLG